MGIVNRSQKHDIYVELINRINLVKEILLKVIPIIFGFFLFFSVFLAAVTRSTIIFNKNCGICQQINRTEIADEKYNTFVIQTFIKPLFFETSNQLKIKKTFITKTFTNELDFTAYKNKFTSEKNNVCCLKRSFLDGYYFEYLDIILEDFDPSQYIYTHVATCSIMGILVSVLIYIFLYHQIEDKAYSLSSLIETELSNSLCEKELTIKDNGELLLIDKPQFKDESENISFEKFNMTSLWDKPFFMKIISPKGSGKTNFVKNVIRNWSGRKNWSIITNHTAKYDNLEHKILDCKVFNSSDIEKISVGDNYVIEDDYQLQVDNDQAYLFESLLIEKKSQIINVTQDGFSNVLIDDFGIHDSLKKMISREKIGYYILINSQSLSRSLFNNKMKKYAKNIGKDVFFMIEPLTGKISVVEESLFIFFLK